MIDFFAEKVEPESALLVSSTQSGGLRLITILGESSSYHCSINPSHDDIVAKAGFEAER